MKKIFILTLLLTILGVSAQNESPGSVTELQSQMKRYEAEIAQLNKLINSNNKQQTTYSQNLKLINQKISNRKKIVANLDQQITIVESQLGAEGTRVVRLSSQLNKLQKDYTELVKLAYLNYRNNSIQTLISSNNDYLQSVRNIVNIDKMAQSLRTRATHIDSLHRGVRAQMVRLTGEQERIAKLVNAKGAEVAALNREKKQLSLLAQQLKNQSVTLKDKESSNRKKLQSLQNQIAQIIVADSKQEKSKPTDFALSGEFEQNIGKLPSPVSGGVVVDRFGVHDHPTQAGIKISNNGINIACSSGSVVGAIFSGEVKNIFMVPAMGNCIIVRHGAYLSVYSNIQSVSVKVGDKVDIGQKLGTVDKSQNILHFELWKETTMLDPQKWLSI